MPPSGRDDRDSLFFVSLPKSGTVYTWTCLRDMTGLRMPDFHLLEGWRDYNSGRDFSCPDLYACGDYNTQLLRPEQMKLYLKGYIFGAHMQASYHNMRILDEVGIRRVSVLLRDPRDAFVSWVHHLRELGLAARNYHSRIYHIPRDYYDWPIERQFDFQARAFLPTTINWVEGWLDYYASEDRKVDILLVYYDELKSDPEAYLRKIVEFHQIDGVDFSKVVVPEQGKLHYRKGEHDQWQVDLSASNRALAMELLGDRIVVGFDRAARSHSAFRVAREALERGDPTRAAVAAFRVLSQFNNFAPAYEILSRAAALAGVDGSDFDTDVARGLGTPSIEGCFRVHDALVGQAAALLQRITDLSTREPVSGKTS